MKKIRTTLCVVYKHPKILLGMKKKGFGKGKWNGFGGKIEPNESIESAARREMREEAGVEVKEMRKLGILNFEFQHNTDSIEMHIFRVDDFVGEPSESGEMKPKWFHVEKIPFKNMWSDDELWFPLFLRGAKFRGNFLFDKKYKIIEQELSKVRKV